MVLFSAHTEVIYPIVMLHTYHHFLPHPATCVVRGMPDARVLPVLHIHPLLLCPGSQAAEDQLQRIQLLVQLKQYDNARMQLREGAFKNLRGDLRYEELYRGVAAQVSQVATSSSWCKCCAGAAGVIK